MTATIHLHGALSHAAAQQVLREIGATLRQDNRGNLHLVPKISECPRCNSINALSPDVAVSYGRLTGTPAAVHGWPTSPLSARQTRWRPSRQRVIDKVIADNLLPALEDKS